MHILFIGYGKTSQRVAKQLSRDGYQITTISQTAKIDLYANHLIQDVHQLDLSAIAPVDVVYVLLSPSQSGVDAYQNTYLDSVAPIISALKTHPVQRIIVVSSTRVYAEAAGGVVGDDTAIAASDRQAEILIAMENHYRAAFAERCIIVRPTGIYGNSITRMVKLAENTLTYPSIHWSNRIHIDDLARFLVHLIHIKNPLASYICSDHRPLPLHQIIIWFQQQLTLPELYLTSDVESGKKIYAQHMLESGFILQYPDCFQSYQALLDQGVQS
ncbi:MULTISPECIES: NAD(P)H-binding protein [unclassified Acinetobacter]|uniref:NAD(P)H-binding protein n=1 Tax=unclassified Acinetobacter TaxID=196816 RepID=UPI002934D043|nr:MULTISPECIES: NAD(P)H-binding protein [unclassified Acinetobacter]WOE31149.1 NAD(P)H-binding protein [Acinetobacter sp. SAAs470]WOE39345.1 NAD(P)H-binding protein [Acinetobacter sp. SAAs474]